MKFKIVTKSALCLSAILCLYGSPLNVHAETTQDSNAVAAIEQLNFYNTTVDSQDLRDISISENQKKVEITNNISDTIDDITSSTDKIIKQKKTDDKKAEQKRLEKIKKEKELKKAQEKAKKAQQTQSYSWDGSVLTKSKGVNYGPSGKETYYNLDMSGCVRIMRGMGNKDKYWVRDDGCKMLGDYIMCAANLTVHKRGSLVESSLGTCIVVDTGTFAAGNPSQLDIAVTW